MAWDDTQIATDSITHTEWNTMVTFINASTTTTNIDHDTLKNFASNEHFTKADLQDDNITWTGTHQFDSTVSCSSSVTVNGLSIDTATLTGTYTLQTTDDVVFCNGTFTVTLPPVSYSTGKVYRIKNIGSGTITIGGGGVNIDGDATIYLYNQYESYNICCDGSNWFLI